MKNVRRVAENMGMSETEFAFYNLLSKEKEDDGISKTAEEPPAYGEVKEPKKELAGLILESLEGLAVIDWIQKEDIQREMRKQIKRHLRSAGYNLDEIEPLTTKLMDLARVRLGREL